MTAYYFKNPFATGGTKVAIPTEAAGDNSVSYANGWTPPYEADQDTDPDYLNIPRGQMNQLFYQMTLALQQYQQYGAPDWITSADNGGSPYAYHIYAQVYYGSNVYQNLVAANTATPGADGTWLLVSGSSDSIQVGMSTIWNSVGSPTGRYLFEDGSAISRTTYSALFAVLCPTTTANTTNSSDLITNLASTAEYHIGMKVEGAGIPAGATVIAIPGGTSVQISSPATATATGITVRFFVWGAGDGTTTFNIPNKTDSYIAGAGGSGIPYAGNTYSKVGQSLGSATYEIQDSDLPDHTHDNNPAGGPFITHEPASSIVLASGATLGANYNHGDNTGGVTGFTSQTDISTIPPTKLAKSFIRY